MSEAPTKPKRRRTGKTNLAAVSPVVYENINDETGEVVANPMKEGEDDAVKIKIAGHLISYALEEYDLLLDQRGQPYASKKEGATNVAVPLDSLRHPLAARYYDEMGAPASTSAWPEAAQTLHGLALRNGGRRSSCATVILGDDLVIDLGRDDGQCVVIDGSGWAVVSAAEVAVKFRRADGTVELPGPRRGRTLEHLRLLLGRSQIRVGVDPRLDGLGAARRHAVPDTAPDRRAGNRQDAAREDADRARRSGGAAGAAAGKRGAAAERRPRSRVYGIDNLTHIQPWLSDGLCALVTGERERRRKLYTDATAFYLEIKSAVIMTGISLSGAGPDLLERMLPIQLDKIDQRDRREELALLREVEEARAEHFGGLLDIASQVLASIAGSGAPPNLPRMADFACVLDALDRTGSTTGAFAHYVEVSPIVSAYEALDSTDFGSDLFRWMEGTLPNVGDEWSIRHRTYSDRWRSRATATRSATSRSPRASATRITRAGRHRRCDAWRRHCECSGSSGRRHPRQDARTTARRC